MTVLKVFFPTVFNRGSVVDASDIDMVTSEASPLYYDDDYFFQSRTLAL